MSRFLYIVRVFLVLIPILAACGVRLDISSNKYENIVLPEYYTHQSMAIFNNSALFVTPTEGHKLICDIYDITLKKKTNMVELPILDYHLPHANVSCFSKLYYNTKSLYPCLYVSQWSGKRVALVYDLFPMDSSICANLVQVIDPSELDESVVGAGYLDWVVDDKGKFVYSIAYKRVGSDLDSTANAIHITKFLLPDPRKTNHVVLKESDILDSFILPIMNATQDKCFFNGYLYIAGGYPNEQRFFPNVLYRVNVNTKEVKRSEIMLRGEPEGLSVYNNQLLLNMYGNSGILYYLDKYLNDL